jgi:hypothetical protein
VTNLTNEEKIKLYMEDRRYDFSICRILNPKQYGLYIKHNVTPLDIFWNDGKVCFVFDKQETQDLYEQWDSSNPNKQKG